ncbi:uncharacterized protein LOC128868744 isoform X4 [Anastrepha ludens]|uniref:uncharacterized protein LOC128868744 isoform X4 n=1 Tax=Anastrepha ludens TaxID=28586 RepID=UPI0023AF155C|nr:uncharacterized protein LOC128868744 isoform X4 [Anastrepha ludens]
MQQTRSQQRASSHPLYLQDGLSPKKTAVIIVTVVGCIAILWPKVFYPMMFGGIAPTKSGNLKDQRGPGDFHSGLRQERPAHLHPESIYQAMRERGRAIPATTPTVPILERKGSPSNPPPRIIDGRPGPIPGMRPPMGAGSMHQPQGRGGNSMGFIMPLYTIGIIVFFGYTIMKIVFKRPISNTPYGPTASDPNFRKEVFGQENGRHVEELNGSKIGPRLYEHISSGGGGGAGTGAGVGGGSDLYNASLATASAASNLSTQLKQHSHGIPASFGGIGGDGGILAAGFNKETEQLMEIEKLRKKLEDTEKAMAKLIAEMNSDQYEAKQKSSENSTSNFGDISNGHTKSEPEHAHDHSENTNKAKTEENALDSETQSSAAREEQQEARSATSKPVDGVESKNSTQQKKRDGSVDRSVAVLGMEVTASCEGGKKWTGRPPTPVFFSHPEHSKDDDEDQMPEPQSIYLEGALAHESQILVADSETKTEEVYDTELNGSLEEPAVVLSSKMTLSLINLDINHESSDDQKKPEVESPLADDIEIIGDDEK